MDVGTTKTELLDRIERERQGWEALLAEVGEERMARPGVAGAWTFKDVAGHLNGWRERTLQRLEAARRGGSPPAPPWPAELDEETDDGTDRINDWIYRRNKDRPLEDVLAESRDQFRRLADAVRALPERDLFASDRFAWTNGEPLGPSVVGGSFGHFHEEHEAGIRSWLGTLDATS